MAFDLSTASPVSPSSSGGFDLTTAKPAITPDVPAVGEFEGDPDEVQREIDGMPDPTMKGLAQKAFDQQYGGSSGAPGKDYSETVSQYHAGTLGERQKAIVDELAKRGEIELGLRSERTQTRQDAMKKIAEDVGPLQAFLIGAGRGFYNIGRGVGLVDPADQTEEEAMTALKKERPITTTAGEITGEAAPFLVPGTAASSVASVPLRVLASGAVGAAEGGILERGQGGEGIVGAGMGAGISMGAEILFPVLGRLGRKIFQKVTGKVPKGAMLNAAGKPTPELKEALDKAGMSFDDLTDDAIELLGKQKPGADPEQAARAAMFKSAGVPATKGEVTKNFEQLATEQRLLESSADTAAEPFRQFKLKQSEAIKKSLRDNLGFDPDVEETGQIIKDSLEGRKKLLRTQKNDLYQIASENAKKIGGIPIFTDNLKDAIPDADLFEDLSITAPWAMKSLDQILTKYGIKEPSEEATKKGFSPDYVWSLLKSGKYASEEAIEKGFSPTPLTIDNFERFRKTLNAIGRGDQTGAAGVAIGPIKEALDNEISELGSVLKGRGVSDKIVEPFLRARETVRTIKTEFSPQSFVGKIVDSKKDGVTQIVEASKVYSKISSKNIPVEETRKLVRSLGDSPDGEKAIASLQATTLLDLIDAGFGTESRKISGVKTFNPIAFKRRLANIGEPKLNAIFGNNLKALKNIKNIEKISSELVPPSGAVQKGSANIILDLANKIGLATISSKVPGGAFLMGTLQKMAEPIKTGATIRTALNAEPEVQQLVSQFPGIASAIGIAATITEDDQ